MDPSKIVENRTYRYVIKTRTGKLINSTGKAIENVKPKGPHTSSHRWVLKDKRRNAAPTVHANQMRALKDAAIPPEYVGIPLTDDSEVPPVAPAATAAPAAS